MADRPWLGGRLGGVCLWWLAGPGRAGGPVWLVEPGWLVAGDGLAGWLAAVAWPGMAA